MKTLYFILIILVSLGVSSCDVSFNTGNERIAGGNEIDIHNAPYQVAISIRNTQNRYAFRCGGVLIDRHLVLTAAQCLLNEQLSTIRVYAGTPFVTKLTTYSDVESVVIHKEYQNTNKNYYNDIGLIQLKDSFSESPRIQTIKLRSIAVPTGTSCTTTGWGNIASDGPKSEKLKRATVPIYDKAQCNDAYQTSTGQPLHTGTVCAGYQAGGQGSCEFDTGGPLVCNGELTGIVSFSNGCGLPNFPAVYTEVMYYRQWINSTNNSTYANGANSLFVFMFTILIQVISYVVLK